MLKRLLILTTITLFSMNISCQNILPGAYNLDEYLVSLKNKKVAVVANQSSELNGISLIDTLLSLDVNVVKIFSPEHGFRGDADAGATVKDGRDEKTGLQILSLYGKNKKPSDENLKGIDIIVFDLQDVGVRFYTYISTLHYVMEACGENNIPLIVLDRPNPNIRYIDGPILKMENKSFVGMHPVPVVYGMTIGEYAQMINGESWLQNSVKCDLDIIKIKNYTRNSKYNLPVKPSPNLPNSKAINLYPSLCFFEGTIVSAGRGTDMQFQIWGAPQYKNLYSFSFNPKSNEGAANPKFNGEICYGEDLRKSTYLSEINLQYLIDAYNKYPNKDKFFNNFFDKLAGNSNLRMQIINNLSASKIKESWKPELEKFNEIRLKYLIY